MRLDLGCGLFGRWTWSSRQLPAGLAWTPEKQLRVTRIHLSFFTNPPKEKEGEGVQRDQK